MEGAGRGPRAWPTSLVLPLTILAWLAVLVVVGWLLSHVARTILMVLLGTIVAFALTPLVEIAARWIPRVLAIAIAYLLAFGLIVGLIAVVGVTLATQIASLVHNLPSYAEQAKHLQPEVAQLLAPMGISGDQLEQARVAAVDRAEAAGSKAAADVLGFARTFLGAVVDAVLVLMLSIYLTANGPRIRNWFHGQAPPGQRDRARLLTGIVNQVVGGYIRGTVLLALLIGLLVGTGMGLVFHLRYALLLGVLAFFLEFIPILGVFISGGVCVAVALFTGPVTALLVLVYFVVVHVIEGDVIGPRIMGRAVGIHPAVALVALLAGTELFGLWGALFGAPLAGLLQAIVTAGWHEYRAGAHQVVEGAASRRSGEAGGRRGRS